MRSRSGSTAGSGAAATSLRVRLHLSCLPAPARRLADLALLEPALCLGAKAVGLGRPFLFANAYGEQGAEKVITSASDPTPSARCPSGCPG